MRVAMIIQRFRPDFSGQGVQVEHLCGALAGRGIHCIVISAVRGRRSDREECAGYEIRRLRADLLPGSGTRSRLWTPTFGLRVFAALMRMDRVDVVHVHGLHDGLYGAALYCRVRGVPLVFEMTLMGVDDPDTALATGHRLRSLRRRIYRRLDAYVAMSRAFLPGYRTAGLPPERLQVIPQGVDTNRFRPLTPEARGRARSELGCRPDAQVVVFLGSLVERKGLDVLLKAWPDVHRAHPGAYLVLAGRDDFAAGSPERRFLDERFAALPRAAKEAIRRIGLRDDPERVLAAADVFVLPSRREGFGSAIIEAMACGVPAVVTRLDGITDFIFRTPASGKDGPAGADGVVVPQDSPPALAGAIAALLADPIRGQAIGAVGRARVRDAFDLHRVVAPAYDRLYRDLLERRP